MDIKEVELKQVRKFIETHHYSRNVNGLKVSKCYGLYIENELKGALLFGQLSTTAWKKYATNEKDIVELRRMVVLDDMPKNTGTFFLSKAIKMIKKSTKFKIIVSYADPYHGHCGIIYQAANWSYWGETATDVLLKTPEGKLYHSRAMRTKYKGKLKPFAERLVALERGGLLEKVNIPGKHVYIYQLTGKHHRSNKKQYPKPS